MQQSQEIVFDWSKRKWMPKLRYVIIGNALVGYVIAQ
jgi:hypothetical protein